MKVMLCALMIAVVALPAWAFMGGSSTVAQVKEVAEFGAELDAEAVIAEWNGRLTRRSISYLEGLVEPRGAFLAATILENSVLDECEYEFARRVALGLKLLETEEFDLGAEELLALAHEGNVRAAHAFAARFANEVGFYDAWKHLVQNRLADELIVQAYQVAWLLRHPQVF